MMNKLSEEAQALMALFMGIILLVLVCVGLQVINGAVTLRTNQRMFNEAYTASLECRQAVSAAHAKPGYRTVDYDEVCGQVPIYVGIEK